MTSEFTEVLFGLMEIVWMMAVAVILFITIPVWILPYTLYKIWRNA